MGRADVGREVVDNVKLVLVGLLLLFTLMSAGSLLLDASSEVLF